MYFAMASTGANCTRAATQIRGGWLRENSDMGRVEAAFYVLFYTLTAFLWRDFCANFCQFQPSAAEFRRADFLAPNGKLEIMRGLCGWAGWHTGGVVTAVAEDREEKRENDARPFRVLFLAFFFLGMSPGFWTPGLTNLLGSLGHGAWVPAAFFISPLCALVSPLIGGALADQRVSAEKLFSWSMMISGGFLAAAFGALDAGWHPGFFIGFLGLHSLASAPAWGFLAVIALRGLRDGDRKFPLVRLGGTFGWVAAGLATSFLLRADFSAAAGYAGAVARIGTGFLGFLLPVTPPLGVARGWRSRLGLDALGLLRERDHCVFFLVTALYSIPLMAFYMYSPEFLRVLGDGKPTATMALAQVLEVAGLLTIGRVMGKFPVKRLLLAALVISVLRFALCAVAGETGERLWLVLGISLHGICYTYYFITAQVYLDRRVSAGLRGQAQGLLSLFNNGLGSLAGALFCGWLRGALVGHGNEGWHTFWWVLTGMIALCAVVLAVFYRGVKVR